jgi:tight adherence protein B
MYSVLGLLLVLLFGVVALRVSRASRLRRLAMNRIAIQIQDPDLAVDLAAIEAPFLTFPRRFQWAIPVVGVFVAGLILALTDLPRPYAAGISILASAIFYLYENARADAQVERMESQLADAIDLLVASLRAGSALPAALAAALRDARMPIREELENMVGRIRIGDDPRTVAEELARRVPLESFRLFSHTLLVHWETGGSLTSSLRTVGRTVRDRLEVSRRISAQAVESQVSVVAVMGITYGLMAFMLRTNPDPMKKLMYSGIGSYSAAALMVLQSAGSVWIWRMSRIRF